MTSDEAERAGIRETLSKYVESPMPCKHNILAAYKAKDQIKCLKLEQNWLSSAIKI